MTTGATDSTALGASSLVRRPALISAALAPVFFIGGTIVAGALWPSYDPLTQTISELAAGDAPTRVFMTVMFVLTAACHGVTGIFAVGIGWPGRAALMAASVATFAVAIFALPTVAGTSVEHRWSAIAGFILLAVWPLLGMRRGARYPWIIRPTGAMLGTGLMTVFCFWFLAVWSNPGLGYIGFIERVAANLESVWPLIVGLGLWLHERPAREPATETTSR
ncbi:MAG: DUF998 domain-containing protein [Rhodoglobus sp.]